MTTDQINSTQHSEPEINKKTPNSFKIVVSVIVLSVVFGAAGGSATVFYLLKKSAWVKTFNSLGSQNITVTEESSIIDVVKKTSPAVVSIVISKDLNKIPGFGMDQFNDNNDFFSQFFGQNQNPKNSQPNIQQVGAGSGFFVSADGLILTNRHVVNDEQASYTVITSDKKSYVAKVLARDPRNDLAIVKIDAKNLPYLNLADSSKTQIGQRVIAIGNSLGQYQNTVTTGIVSGIGRSITAGGQDGSEQLEGVIQTDAAINPGNSGGPLLNVAGQVIGINTAIDNQGQLVGFSIPSNDVAKALASYEKNGKITRPYLGIRYLIITQALADAQKLPKNYGALVIRGQTVTDFAVIPGSPADKAGIMENDIILEVNGKKIDENNTLSASLKDFNSGDEISLKVYHKGGEKMVKVRLEDSK